MLDRFLSTKLYLPRPRPELVYRPRLVASLDAIPPGGVAFLAAPAGSGKTVLAVQWLNGQRATHSVAWIALDAADNDAGRFWSAVVAALRAADPALLQGAEALVRGRGPRESEALPTTIINALAAHEAPIILALDHLNAIDNAALMASLAFVLDNLPENTRAVLTTRVEPALPITRWRVDGRLVELTEAELRFNLDEVRHLLSDIDGLPIDNAQVALLTERTEGWIAGLTLAARAARDRGVEAVIASFDGSHRYVGDYLAAEVLDVLPDAVRTFLVTTAVLDRLSGPLCDAVTGAPDGTSQALLEQLDADNVFVVALDDQRQWYRYHRLFADALRTRLVGGSAPTEVDELHRRAARWYEANGYVARAVRHSLEAGDEVAAAELILRAADDNWTQGRAATLQAWIAALPAGATERHPRLGVYQALSLVLIGQSFETIDPLLEQLDRRLAADTPGWRGRLAVVRGTVAGVRGLSDAAAAQARVAMALLDPDDLPWRGLATIDLGLAELARGEDGDAARAFAEARVLGIRAGNPYATLAASVNLARAHHGDGALHAAAAAYREALACADENALHQLPLTGLAHIGLGDVLREWNLQAEALERIGAGLALAERRQVHVRVAVAGHLALAQLEVCTRRWDAVWSALAAAEALALRFDRPELLADVRTLHALIGLQAGDPGPALRWAADTSASEEDASDADALLLARLAIFQGEFGRANARLGALRRRLGDRPGRFGTKATAALLEARLALTQGDQAAAAVLMRSALTLALPEGFVRIFLDEGPIVAQLLDLSQRGVDAEGTADGLANYAADLMRAMPPPLEPAPWAPGDPATTAPPPRAVDGPILEPLSAREREVLDAIAGGATNQEIADRLVIALSTVKTHVNNIYGKLGVRNRTQAVARARALHLL